MLIIYTVTSNLVFRGGACADRNGCECKGHTSNLGNEFTCKDKCPFMTYCEAFHMPRLMGSPLEVCTCIPFERDSFFTSHGTNWACADDTCQMDDQCVLFASEKKGKCYPKFDTEHKPCPNEKGCPCHRQDGFDVTICPKSTTCQFTKFTGIMRCKRGPVTDPDFREFQCKEGECPCSYKFKTLTNKGSWCRLTGCPL